MKRMTSLFAGILYLLTGCSSTTTADYAANGPKLDIRQYLNGKLEAWGVLFDYTGKADLHFHVTMEGSWEGNVGTLKENFVYSDGRKDQRIWTITFTDDTNFTATAHDVEGQAVGTQAGNAVNMKYTLNAVRASGDTITLTMDDWLYRVDEHTVINRTKMRKFGITVGELMIAFRKG
jgi:hypothetical protein